MVDIEGADGATVREAVRHRRPLPGRVLQHLTAAGPDYTVAIAAALEMRDGAVSGALTRLRRDGLVDVAYRARGRGGARRVYYRAAVPVEPPAPDHDGGAVGRDVARLRAAYPDVDIEALIATNRGLRGA